MTSAPKTTSTPPVASSTSSDDFNGQKTDKYTWSQTATDVDVKIPLMSEIIKGKQLIVQIETQSIKIQVVKGLGQVEDIIDGRFKWPIIKQDSYWNLTPGQYVSLFLQKKQERWWSALLEGEPEIDMNAIEASRDVSELPDEEQMKIQELMYDQVQKQKGLPTSSEQKMHSVLKEAWDKEGSPFKGQPFDPSLINFNGTNSGAGFSPDEASS